MTRSRPAELIRCQRGLTLLELLISMAILGLIFLIIGSALRISYNAINTGDRHIERVHRSRVITEQIAQELRSVYHFSRFRTTEKHIAFRGAPDQISFVTSAAMRTRAFTTSGLKEVTLSIKEDTTTGRRGLVLREDIIPNGELFEEDKGYETMLDPTVVTFRCRYFGALQEGLETPRRDSWQDNWVGENPPRAVEVLLAFQEQNEGPITELPPITLVLPIEQVFEMEKQ